VRLPESMQTPADVDPSRFAGAEFVDFQHVSTFDEHDLADGAVHGSGHFGVQLELAVLAVDGNEIFWLDQVDDEFEFVLAGVAADVDGRRGSIFEIDVSLAADRGGRSFDRSFFRCRG